MDAAELYAKIDALEARISYLEDENEELRKAVDKLREDDR